MPKKSVQSFCNWVSDRRITSGSTSVQDLSKIGTVLVDEQPEVRLRGFAFAFGRLAKVSTFVFNANSSDFISEVSCSLSSSVVLLKSVTNLFKP